MKTVLRMSLMMVLVGVMSAVAFAQQEQQMTKEEWQKQVTELTAKRSDLKNKLDVITKEVADLQKQDADKAQALKQCQDALAALQGTQEAPFVALLDQIDAKLNELSRLSNQDLFARKAELDSVQAWINVANKQPISAIQKYADRLKDQQARLDALRKTLEQIIASGEATPTYTVGTWAKDRDCLWNIAKKPKIYDNPFLWPKIWQGNRDQIKNPDVIQPGQKLKIPPKADLTKQEKSALRKYWAKKQAKAAAAPAQP
ncbi:MAG TPA: LysM peptidoglycan-binding domain-containing protein [Bacteroidota bacterium]|nr:LysM peptidoglycan-binding domain-containing protein [Bacteroidota bacterium]